jgi:plastocyanin
VRVVPFKLRIALLMLALAAAGGITATIAQGVDPPSTASFKTVDFADQFQLVSGSGSATSANIVTGGTVSFANSSTETHNVDFEVFGQTGVSCQQAVGGPSPSSVRFPNLPTSGTWSGACTFTKAGTYSFMCDHHLGMMGTVVVSDPGAAPGTTTAPVVTATTPVQTVPSGGTPTTPAPVTTTPAGTTSTPPPTTPTPSAAQTPAAVARKLAFKVVLAQRGSSVRGTVSGARSSARVKIALTARRGAIGLGGKATAPVGVGSLSALTTKDGVLAFAVKLNGKARAALAKRHRLALTVSVTAPPVGGTATPRVFKIVVRP